MRPLLLSVLLLSCGVFSFACEALLGAEFKEFEVKPDGAVPDGASPDGVSPDAGSLDGGSLAEASDDNDAQGGAMDDQGAPPGEDAGSSCTPGDIHDIAACINCGRYVQICTGQGTWDLPFCRYAQDACPPGTTEQRSCEGDGTLTAKCSETCTWTLDKCDHSDCVPDQVEKKPCHFCGTQSRSCQATDGGSWMWSPFSACMDDKDCAPNQIDRGTCGKCGTHSRVCEMQCTWGSWGTCQDEGPCAPGDTQRRGCLIGLLTQTRTCSDLCAWGEWIGLCL
ncbi:MAG TPA: hypothetical protein VK540_34980 [Polyangiaceae bacterium]|nr:hypothetical protein [Polyangiaceae bacterium]